MSVSLNYFGKKSFFVRKKISSNTLFRRKKNKEKIMENTIYYSRCSLGPNRWFWVAKRGDDYFEGKDPFAFGYANTAEDAEAQAVATILILAVTVRSSKVCTRLMRKLWGWRWTRWRKKG
jgi:hypothetical protein